MRWLTFIRGDSVTFGYLTSDGQGVVDVGARTRFAELIEYCSTFTELVAGDVIVTGTPGGVGAARQPPVFMDEGDRVEVEIDPIGILRHSIVLG